MNILIAYFSATGGTKTLADAMTRQMEALGDSVETLDITTPAVRESLVDFGKHHAAIICSPVHYARAPKVVREWVAKLDGKGRPCALLFSYGGFQTDPCHHSLRTMAENRGFAVVASADFPSRHTYNLVGWNAFPDRPGPSEMDAVKEYAKKIRVRFSGDDTALPRGFTAGEMSESEMDELEEGRRKLFPHTPGRNGRECQMCMLCEERCPTAAMKAEAGTADLDLCIFCLRCMSECPDEAITFLDMGPFFNVKMEMDGETEASLDAKRARLFM